MKKYHLTIIRNGEYETIFGEMSSITSFIKEALKEFILSFPKTRVRYEFDIDANVHCIEVVPNSIYHLDNDYINWENNFTNSFIQSFPYQNICFFSDDAIVGINNIEFELTGSNPVLTTK
jgi:hypothetical protein